jgi:hypothetical protein
VLFIYCVVDVLCCCAAAVDYNFFSPHSQTSGLFSPPLFMPLPLPGGGAGAEGAAAGAEGVAGGAAASAAGEWGSADNLCLKQGVVCLRCA